MGEEELIREDNTKNIFSFHTFLLPLSWDNGEENPHKSKKDFEAMLAGSGWVNINWEANALPHICELGPCSTEESNRQAYATYQYFNLAARPAILGIGKTEENIVDIFTYCPQLLQRANGGRRPVRYRIIKGDKTYDLPIYAIRLKVYNTGVATIIFEIENYNYRSEKEVKEINEYGRRIRLPFISTEGYHPLMADQIEITGLKPAIKTDYKRQQEKGPSEEYTPVNFVPDTILRLLGGGGYTVTCNEREKSKQCFYIQPVLDDRMFVACTICNKAFTNAYLHPIKNKISYKYLYDQETAKQLYALLFIDSGSASCQNQQMLHRIFEKCLYTRWADYGTIHAVTHYSMFCLTDGYGDVDKVVVIPFLTMYIEIAALVLAQRASMIIFQKKASEISKSLNQKRRPEMIKQLLILQKEYVAFQNQLLLFEVTPQEQGIEIYQMLWQQLYVREEQKDLEQQLHNLYEIATVTQSASLNKGGLIFAAIAIILAFVQLGVSIIDSTLSTCCRCILSASTCILIAAAGLLFYKYRH